MDSQKTSSSKSIMDPCSCAAPVDTTRDSREVLMQVMVYCGAPAGMEAFRTADAAIKAWKEEHAK